ncbi:DUF16 domain-containing protein [Mycoplasmoides pneumoniae]|uniref:UPF0134 protein MPN_137 n=1 Tax=Mycoplasma pneumoniae (strain ATCC 29342 / M129 / Subtype 1) TaxID=272634 RepID=Y137_MYCPN|nr:DUF16 domain-containing protein [Mycoplasmoides pneumoniae]P75261.1 RecName: Full=UPF0134 protein MPN_137 [Mycoplasmoides pneumoniae M129]AAB95665.1 hypothetical protein MPN_137 [Mycoplasmoides pneumoniae M129]AGC04066.1 hypothetical protein C985_0138 [Mycoplasmoides pneumoniae M129-B7]ALA30023.1 hypothetical protein C897_00820 [Mycoplasmoides pneumoniae PI 1428]ALA32136.1 hypothetical protein F533_00825 [Mycoplasmoides pneumoniae 51494]ALA32838.1 hypothetical protein F530_00825 [Mycoplasm
MEKKPWEEDISIEEFKKSLNKDKITNLIIKRRWNKGKSTYHLSFNGDFEVVTKKPSTKYVTHKQLDQKLKEFKQDLMVELHDTFATKADLRDSEARINQKLEALVQVVLLHGEQINKLTQIVEKQGEQIRELQVEQKAQRQEFNARMDRLENLLVESIESTNKRFDSIEGRLDSMDSRLDSMENRLDSIEGRLDSVEGRLDSVEGRLDSMENRLDSMETRLDKIDPPK